MCGRFALYETPEKIKDHFGLEDVPDLSPDYNIPPGTAILGITFYENALIHMLFRWGFIPHWSKAKQTDYKMINARIEGIWEKPSFRSAIKYRRCLIPASGFYEWKKIDSCKKPYFITISGSGLFAMAGIWETWEGKASQEVIDSCAILTTGARGVFRDIHERMPVIIDPSGYDAWLDPRVQSRNDLNILEISIEKLQAWPVSLQVNSPKNNYSELTDPAP
jgi:putative SOS response-associated peptidase YedK